jgi:hypothetical protein
MAVGLYIGRPMKVRLFEDTRLSLRTSLRDRNGGLEFESPLGLGSFEYRPLAASERDLVASNTVNFDTAMKFDHIVDFSQERYQFSFRRYVPYIDVTSQVSYGASSNAVAGAISKTIAGGLSCVVDTVHALSPFDSARADEQKIRLRYDISF